VPYLTPNIAAEDVVSHRERVVTGRVQSEHIVQLFDSPESRAAGVGAFVHEGLTAGATALVVVKPSHWTAIAADLTARGVNVAGAIASGALMMADAMEALARFMRDDVPVRDLFRAHIGALVAGLPQVAELPVRIYGEMVEVLAECGDFAAATELEEYWNELSQEHSMLLLCGYSSAHFGPERSGPALKAICCSHTKVQTLATDPLGEWLTNTVSPASSRGA
jgi:hypothetical protein